MNQLQHSDLIYKNQDILKILQLAGYKMTSFLHEHVKCKNYLRMIAHIDNITLWKISLIGREISQVSFKVQGQMVNG